VVQSFAITKGRFFEIIRLLLPAVLIVGIVGIVITSLQNERNISVLISRANGVASQNPGTFINDHEYAKTTLAPLSKIGEENYYNLLKISKNYTPSTTTMSEDYLRAIYPYVLEGGSLDQPSDYAVSAAGTILSFLLIEGVMLMVYFSIFQIVSATPAKIKEPKTLKSVPKASTQKIEGKPVKETVDTPKKQTAIKSDKKVTKAKKPIATTPEKTPKSATKKPAKTPTKK
jgi:hypothetical protein